MDPHLEHQQLITRRTLLGRGAVGIGSAALATMLTGEYPTPIPEDLKLRKLRFEPAHA